MEKLRTFEYQGEEWQITGDSTTVLIPSKPPVIVYVTEAGIIPLPSIEYDNTQHIETLAELWLAEIAKRL